MLWFPSSQDGVVATYDHTLVPFACDKPWVLLVGMGQLSPVLPKPFLSCFTRSMMRIGISAAFWERTALQCLGVSQQPLQMTI